MLHFGRRVPAKSHRFHLKNFNPNVSAFPAAVDTSYGQLPAAQACLTNVLLNDKYGCCTQADKFHRQAMRQAAGGNAVYCPSDAVLMAAYTRDGGMPGDQGCDETVVMQNSVSMGDQSDDSGCLDKPLGYLLVDATDRDLVRRLNAALVGSSICMGLPDAWVNNMPSSPGWTWSVPAGGFVADPNNGHCFTMGDANDAVIKAWSWGMPFDLTWDALAAGATEAGGGALYVELSDESIQKLSQKAPDGMDYAALKTAFASMS